MPKRKSPQVKRKRKSPTNKRKSPKRKSPTKKRKSPKHRSPKRKSPTKKRKSPKRKKTKTKTEIIYIIEEPSPKVIRPAKRWPTVQTEQTSPTKATPGSICLGKGQYSCESSPRCYWTGDSCLTR